MELVHGCDRKARAITPSRHHGMECGRHHTQTGEFGSDQQAKSANLGTYFTKSFDERPAGGHGASRQNTEKPADRFCLHIYLFD